MATATKTKTRRATTTPLQGRRLLEQYVLGTSRFVEIPVKDLHVDHKYQRDLNEKAIARMVGEFDLNKFEPPTVNDRHAWNTYSGPRWALIDGQHRRVTAQKLKQETITCRLVSVSPEHEAELFVELNRQRLWVSPMQAFKAELAYGNPAAQEISRCLAERDLIVQTNNKHSNGHHAIAAIVAMKKIYAASGVVGLGRTVDVARLAWPEDDDRRFSGMVLLGLHKYLSKNPKTDYNRLSERLAAMTSTALLAKASARYYAWKSLGTNKSSIDGVVDEIGKAYRRR